LQTLADSPVFFLQNLVIQVRSVLEAIRYMHNMGIIHMDIKESNIFIDHGGNWYIGDFGSSKEINEKITSTNLNFYLKKSILNQPANTKYDYFMLLMVLLRQTIEDKKWIDHLCGEDEKFSREKIEKYLKEMTNKDENEDLNNIISMDILPNTDSLLQGIIF